MNFTGTKYNNIEQLSINNYCWQKIFKNTVLYNQYMYLLCIFYMETEKPILAIIDTM